MKRTIFCLMILSFQYNAICEETLPPKEYLLNIINKNYIGKENCKAGSMFMQCYDVNQTECEYLMLEATKQCYKKYQHQITDDKSFSDLREVVGSIGFCAGVIYDLALKRLKKEDQKCLEDPKWKELLQH